MCAKMENTNNNVGYYHSYKYSSLELLNKAGKMRGVKKVMMFCALTAVLPTLLLVLPLYLRHSLYADVVYSVAESDIMEIEDGISTIFCSEHTLKMNSSFNAFQVSHRPEMTSYRKHIRLKKSMTLPDDTLEYWGFYLLKGATVALSVCSRFQGASVLVVKGERNLRTCGMLDHNTNKAKAKGTFLPLAAEQQVKVTFQSNAQEIDSKEQVSAIPNAYGNQRIPNYTAGKGTLGSSGLETIVPDGAEQSTIRNVNEEDILEQSTERSNIASSVGPESDSTASVDEKRLKSLYETAESYIQRHKEQDQRNERGPTRRLRHAKSRLHKVKVEEDIVEKQRRKYAKQLEDLLHRNSKEELVVRKKRGLDHRFNENWQELVKQLEMELQDSKPDEGGEQQEEYDRVKRSQDLNPYLILDRGVEHGGNAFNISNPGEESSVSSFENGLLTCYEGQVLLAQEFSPSDLCTNVSYLMNGNHMQTRHEVAENGYYYYIFYSDNDFVSNDIHAVFDIYKPTFQYENVSKACLNETKCSFNVGFLSEDRVIVEVPTRDGIEHEEDDITLLVSTCHPRMGMYIIFPVAVLILVLGCAFV